AGRFRLRRMHGAPAPQRRALGDHWERCRPGWLPVLSRLAVGGQLVVDTVAAHTPKLRLHGYVHRLIGAEPLLMLGAPPVKDSLRAPVGSPGGAHGGRLGLLVVSEEQRDLPADLWLPVHRVLTPM